jgi:hypothetical protein
MSPVSANRMNHTPYTAKEPKRSSQSFALRGLKLTMSATACKVFTPAKGTGAIFGRCGPVYVVEEVAGEL